MYTNDDIDDNQTPLFYPVEETTQKPMSLIPKCKIDILHLRYYYLKGTSAFWVLWYVTNIIEFAVNIITECLYSQVDNEGRQHLLLDEIIDYQKTAEAIADEHAPS